jgi:hypothetical protein
VIIFEDNDGDDMGCVGTWRGQDKHDNVTTDVMRRDGYVVRTVSSLFESIPVSRNVEC